MAKQWYKEKKLKQLNIQINMELIKQSKNLILTILQLFDDEVNLKNNGEYGLEWGNGNLNAYPDLIITQSDDSEIYVEFERTQKSPSRFKKKLDEHTKWLRNGGQIYWITPTQTLANWIQRQIDKDDFKTELQKVIIWNTQ